MAFDASILPQYIASAVKFIYDAEDEESPKLYFDELPEQLQCPSVYFPVPRADSSRATLGGTYKNRISFEAWFIGASDYEAYATAGAVRNEILFNKCRIPVLDMDGEETGKTFAITEPVIRKQEERIMRMTFTIDEYFGREEIKTVAKSFRISGLIPVRT